MNQHALEIRGLGSLGEGVGTLDGLVVFVDGALPGETVEVEIVQRKKTYLKGKLLQVLTPSPDRVEPVCPLFGKCGGCQIMHLSYEAQLETKRQRVIDALKRIGHLDVPVEPCQPSEPLAYRNKIQLPLQNGKLGLYALRSNDVVPVEHCYIHSDAGEEIFRKIRPHVAKEKLLHVLIRSAGDQALVALATADSHLRTELAEKIAPFVQGVVQHTPEKDLLLAGDPYIQAKICGLTFRVSSRSFFQVNTAQAERLYQKAIELANITPTTTVLDAYCGVGTLTCLIAQKAKSVTGIECVPEAIQDAKENAKLNQLTNTHFICAQVENTPLPPTDVTFLNPPRKGCDPKVLGALTSERILYISCNPATLARDLAHLTARGYQVHTVEPFDMFPQTAHVECLASLSLPSPL